MPPLILAAGVLFLGYSAVKLFKAAKLKAQSDLDAVRQAAPKDLGNLKKDPVTGNYRAE
jgi:hypothetical protein